MPTAIDAPPELPDVGDDGGGGGDEPEGGPARDRGWWARAVTLLVAVAFLGGTVGYFVGTRGAETPSNAVDVGFLQDMSDHHDQAVTMALLAYDRTDDPIIRSFAQDVLIFQRYELGQMAAYLADHDAARPDFDPQRTAMAWMDMGVPLSQMPGMASDADIAALGRATGTDLDRHFLELMTSHHEGGVHMASYAAEHAADPKVRALAQRMATYQATEINEYRDYLDRMNATS